MAWWGFKHLPWLGCVFFIGQGGRCPCRERPVPNTIDHIGQTRSMRALPSLFGDFRSGDLAADQPKIFGELLIRFAEIGRGFEHGQIRRKAPIAYFLVAFSWMTSAGLWSIQQGHLPMGRWSATACNGPCAPHFIWRNAIGEYSYPQWQRAWCRVASLGEPDIGLLGENSTFL
jgi:hypothetical protein